MHMKCLLYSNFFEYNVYIFNRNNFYVSIKKRKRKSLQTLTISLRKKKKKNSSINSFKWIFVPFLQIN